MRERDAPATAGETPVPHPSVVFHGSRARASRRAWVTALSPGQRARVRAEEAVAKIDQQSGGLRPGKYRRPRPVEDNKLLLIIELYVAQGLEI